MTRDSRPTCVHELEGPDGGKLLGFLAALGTVVALSDAWPDRDVRLSWSFRAAWRPVLSLLGECTEDEITQALDQELRHHPDGPEFVQLGDDLPVDGERFRAFAEAAAEAATPSDRRWADFVVAWGSEAVTDGKKIRDTAFRTMSGAGHQHFLGFMRTLAKTTNEKHFRAALFAPWRYEDDPPSMRWDPVDDRRYAHRADDPAKSSRFPIRTVQGANRLAVEALRCFPTAPRGRELVTTGFTLARGRGQGAERSAVLRWPIWERFLALPAIRPVLSHPSLWEDPLPARPLWTIGVAEVFESRRFTEGWFRKLLPCTRPPGDPSKGECDVSDGSPEGLVPRQIP